MNIVTILILLILPFSSFARSPAVGPVTGISIDEYKDVPPSQAKGFNWKNSEDIKPSFDSSKLPEQGINTEEGPDLSPAIVLFFMSILPFGIWFFLLGKLADPAHDIGYQEEGDDGQELKGDTLAFPPKAKKYSKNDDEDDDDFNLPKAS